MKTTLTTNNTISAVGNYRIISYSAPFKDVQVVGFSDQVSGEPIGSPNPGYQLIREWRWSINETQWSLWLPFVPGDSSTFSVLDGKDEFLLEFRYMVESVLDAPYPTPPGTAISPDITIDWLDLVLSSEAVASEWSAPQSRCSTETSLNPVLLGNATFDPYAVNKATQMAEQLSNSVSNMFGHEVSYFKVTPQARSKDVVFMEWTIMCADNPKCFKILVPNNQFPDSKVTYNPFGTEFELPFEIHIDRTAWENTFGKNTMPQEGDFLYMPITNRMYEVQSAYPFKDFMQVPIYFKALLIKYENRQSVLKSESLENLINAGTINTEDLFGYDIAVQEQDVLKKQQYTPQTSTNDIIRSYVAKQLGITKYTIYNNWNAIADHYYNMKDMYNSSGQEEVAVIYRADPNISANAAKSFLCWFACSAGTTSRRTLVSCEDVARRGWRVDFNYAASAGSCSVVLRYNSTDYTFPIAGVTFAEDAWYAMVVNFSTAFQQCSVGIYQTQVGKPALQKVFRQVKAFTADPTATTAKLGLMSGQHIITNIRLLCDMVEEEHEALVLTQNVFADASKALIIDNSRPLLRIARVGQP